MLEIRQHRNERLKDKPNKNNIQDLHSQKAEQKKQADGKKHQ